MDCPGSSSTSRRAHNSQTLHMQASVALLSPLFTTKHTKEDTPVPGGSFSFWMLGFLCWEACEITSLPSLTHQV